MTKHRLETLEAMYERAKDKALSEEIKNYKIDDKNSNFNPSALIEAKRKVCELEIVIAEKKKQGEKNDYYAKVKEKIYKMPFDSIFEQSNSMNPYNIIARSDALNREFRFVISRRWGESKLRYYISSCYMEKFRNMSNEEVLYSGDKKGFLFYLDIIKSEISNVRSEKTEEFIMNSAGYVRQIINDDEIKIPFKILQKLGFNTRNIRTVEFFVNDNAICMKKCS